MIHFLLTVAVFKLLLPKIRRVSNDETSELLSLTRRPRFRDKFLMRGWTQAAGADAREKRTLSAVSASPHALVSLSLRASASRLATSRLTAPHNGCATAAHGVRAVLRYESLLCLQRQYSVPSLAFSFLCGCINRYLLCNTRRRRLGGTLALNKSAGCEGQWRDVWLALSERRGNLRLCPSRVLLTSFRTVSPVSSLFADYFVFVIFFFLLWRRNTIFATLQCGCDLLRNIFLNSILSSCKLFI